LSRTVGDRSFAGLPDPGAADSLDAVAVGLRKLKVWAGNPSYDTIMERVNRAWRDAGRPEAELTRRATVADCFRTGRRRLNADLVMGVVHALHPDVGYVSQWRQALRVIGGEAEAAAQVRVRDTLPDDLPGFIGRMAEIDRLRHVLRSGTAAVISAIAGMAGVGKTQLAVHAGHLLLADGLFDRVLFVNLRGFHPDDTQPPAEPGAVLDGFLRLLGVPGGRIPHGVPARTQAFQAALAGTRTLVVLDNAATADQVRRLLPATPGCAALVTSRRGLDDLADAVHLEVDVFTPGEAVTFLEHAVPDVPGGTDPQAAARIARCCGYLPLALGLIGGHIRGRTGWTLTDHADRLDERHRDKRIDRGVEVAVGLSYEHLPQRRRRLLRLVALHPGQDLDVYAAAALTGDDVPSARADLGLLCRDHLVQQTAAGRYALHDLIRAYAAGRAADEDPPAARAAAMTRLFDHYQATAAAAADTLYPAEAFHRPRVPAVAGPDVASPEAALAWLDAERATLVTVAGYAAARGWPGHAARLSALLYRYLDGGHTGDALTVHTHALHAAAELGDAAAQAHALNGLGTAYLRVGRHETAAGYLRRALLLFEQTCDATGQGRVLGSLGNIEKRQGRFAQAMEHQNAALILFQKSGDLAGQARALRNLAVVEGRTGRYAQSMAHLEEAAAMCRAAGDRLGEADVVAATGEMLTRQGDYPSAARHCRRAVDMFHQLGELDSAFAVRDDLGIVLTRLGRPTLAIPHHEAALAFAREAGDGDGASWVLNGLGEALHAAGRPADALTHFAEALATTTELGLPDQRARAHAGLSAAHRALGRPDEADRHQRESVTLYRELGMPEGDG